MLCGFVDKDTSVSKYHSASVFRLFTLKLKAVVSVETSVPIYKVACHHVTEERIIATIFSAVIG